MTEEGKQNHSYYWNANQRPVLLKVKAISTERVHRFLKVVQIYVAAKAHEVYKCKY